MNIIIKALVALTLFLTYMTSIALANTYSVDDGYTVYERYARYSKKQPSMQYPTIALAHGACSQFDIAYFEHKKTDSPRSLHLDVFYPNSHPICLNEKAASQQQKNYSSVVLIHGGGWRSGNKSHMHYLASLLVQKGYLVFVPEYTLSVEAPYPASLTDLQMAFSWIEQQQPKLLVDLNNISIGGGSSGGHIAALIGLKNDNPSGIKFKHIIDLDGVLNLTDEAALKYENKKGKNSAMALWLSGLTFEENPRLWQAVSPVEHINTESANLLLIGSGQARFSVGFQLAKTKLNKLGKTASEFHFDNIPHTFWLFEPWASQVAEKIDTFIKN